MTGGASAGGAMPANARWLSADLGAHADAFLRLAALASSAHDAFAFPGVTEAHDFYAALLRGGGADFAPPAGRLLLLGNEPAGMFAVVEPGMLRRRRLMGGVVVAREQRSRADRALAERLRRAAGTLATPSATDGYLSRLAVHPTMARRGLGRALLQEALETTRALGLARCVLEVSDGNDRAIALYRQAGFTAIGEASTTDPETGIRLGYLHLAKVVRDAGQSS